MSEEIIAEAKMGLSFSRKRRRVLIHFATIRALGCPDQIRLLLNKDKKRLAVQVCEPIDRDSFPVPDHIDGKKYAFEITSISMLSGIYNMCGWNPDQTYVCYGKLHKKYRLVEFKLETAEIISPDQFIDPENL